MATPLPTLTVAFGLGEAAEATRASLSGGRVEDSVRGLTTDSRTVTPGALFVALVGEHHDGHHHLAAAVAAGAGAALVRRGTGPVGVPTLEVDDTLAALGDLAAHHLARERARRGGDDPLRVVAITGSAGKTTTKELTAAAMGAAFGAVHATRGNLNNLVGVPLTALGVLPEHRAAVIECGTNRAGEVPRLGAIVRPDVGVVLNADAGHTQGLGSVEGVAKEKGALFEHAVRAMVGNADDPRSAAEMVRGRGEPWRFGEGEGADVRLVGRAVGADGRARLTVRFGPRCPETPELEVGLALVGKAAALDACAALCATAAAGARGEALVAAARALGDVRPVAGRLSLTTARGVRVLDDTYNANPRSVAASLEAAAEVARGLGARLVVALGDMFELGALSREEHEKVGARVREAGAAVFVAVGQDMSLAGEVARRAGVRVARASDAREAGVILAGGLLEAGDVVLLKGSRGMAMERALGALVGGEGEA